MAASRATAVVWREERWLQMAAAGTGLAALMVYLGPGLAAPGAHWPLWDVRVYWWGGQQAARGGTLYAPGARYSFTYPPFAAVIFSVAARAPEGALAAVITAGSVGALAGFCALALGAAGVQRRPGTVFAASALALLTWPVAYTLHLGEINLIVAAMAGTDLLRRRDGGWWQGIATGLAAGIKLTPLIFVVFLLITGRVRAAITAAGTFAATIALGAIVLPTQSRTYWFDGVFWRQDRIGNPANPSDQSLAGAVARLASTAHPAQTCWLAQRVTGLTGGRFGVPARPPAGRSDLLRHHRPADLSVLLDAPLGMGSPAVRDADHHGAAAPLALVRPRRRGSGHRLLRNPPADSTRLCAQPRAAAAR